MTVHYLASYRSTTLKQETFSMVRTYFTGVHVRCGNQGDYVGLVQCCQPQDRTNRFAVTTGDQ
jgi:hypothetical protein